MTPETMPTDEKENLIAATEENVRYWTQRIIDATERPFFKDDVEKVIRELLTADTNESVVASLRAEVKAWKAEIDKIKQHTGAPSLQEAFDVLIRTKARDEDVIESQFNKIKEQSAQLAKRQWVAFDSIFCELERATNKFPTWPTDPHHAANVLAEEVGELVKTIVEHTYEPHKSTREDVRTEAKQAAAMALRFFLSMDAYQFKPCDQHSQSGKMPIPPTQEPATAETCPTCGSADKSVRESVSKPNCGPPLFPCQDAWHNKPTPDPLAEVKAHHAKGGRVEVKRIASTFWTNLLQREAHLFSDPALQFRIHPDDIAPAPAWTLPAPPPGQQWHRWTCWNEERLPAGYRPLLDGEVWQFGDEYLDLHDKWVHLDENMRHATANNNTRPARTKRPLPTSNTWQLPPGDWHRKDFTEDMLPEGYRPLLMNEKIEDGDERNSRGEGVFFALPHGSNPPERADEYCTHFRTRRPLPSPPRVEMPKIKTRFIHPPIPIRNFDWEATRDGYDKGDPIGFGRTEELAKADLLEQEGS